ncbi:hypothetical protein GQF61_17390 [Sphingobacterium sp. DK4209]|uniref:Uncharacterized protein n=1 Tax=Sphingobacterium zhuxiongii TaxID=2662364 RepID=A0A5Q0QCW0_9SPHI|nr:MULTISPECIES: hypothetical protein [unclassified Sphingobacterium]MVZ67623.1 hypothetical protein [Sphingobacterium sp. DK4209]QGA27144.1 hypothetical protein GFH32_12815 [Sphingobacterium sp. dk4302]
MNKHIPEENSVNWNVSLSAGLILTNTLLAIVCFGGVYEFDPDSIRSIFAFLLSITILIGIFAFGYRGKSYRWAMWLFVILLIISIMLLGLAWYATQLGKAFKN